MPPPRRVGLRGNPVTKLDETVPYRATPGDANDDLVLNDVQSALNATHVRRIVRPGSVDDVVAAVRGAAAEDAVVATSGSLHSMGGQQFATDGVQIDTQ